MDNEVVMPGAFGDKPVKVPLTIYIGEERKIIGEAVVTGDEITAYISPQKDKADGLLVQMIQDDIIQSVSVTFNAPPAVPFYRDGTIRWIKTYNREENHDRDDT